MSAQPLLAPSNRATGDPQQRPRRTLRLVPPPRPQLSRVPFLLVLVGLVGFGMVGLLLLNIGLQNQAFDASQLRRQAAEMSYQEGELTQLVIDAGSTRELTRRATELGMRPNRGVAFVQLPDGRVTGKPAAEDGNFLPSALSKTPEQLAQDRAAKAAKRAYDRRTAEQEVLLGHRQRIVAARPEAQAALAAQQAPPAEPAPPAQQAQPAQAGQQHQPVEAQPQPGQPATEPQAADTAGSR